MNPQRSQIFDLTSTRPHLQQEFQRIKKGHQRALVERAARTVPGSSVIRVFSKGTKKHIVRALANIDIDTLNTINDEQEFSKWFDKQVRDVWRAIRPANENRPSISPGGQWGHSTKIVAIFLRSIVLCSRYFSDREAKRLSPFLYVPIDSIIMQRLDALGVTLPFSRIRKIDTRQKFYKVQHILGEAAAQIGVPRIWFDDNWGDRQDKQSH